MYGTEGIALEPNDTWLIVVILLAFFAISYAMSRMGRRGSRHHQRRNSKGDREAGGKRR